MSTHAYRTSSTQLCSRPIQRAFHSLPRFMSRLLVLDDRTQRYSLFSWKKHYTYWKLSWERERRIYRTQLKDLKESLSDTKPAGDLVKLAKTIDQAQAVLTFIEAYSRENSVFDVTLTASRGRGKSAALGMAIAAALLMATRTFCDKVRVRKILKNSIRIYF